MPTFILLTRVDPSVLEDADTYLDLWNEAERRIEAECPDVVWKKDYAVMGPYDYVDVFEAPDNEAAAKVALIIRSIGHADTETWPALPWDRFKGLLRDTSSAGADVDTDVDTGAPEDNRGGSTSSDDPNEDEPRDEVREALEESFPASDPPSYSGGTVS